MLDTEYCYYLADTDEGKSIHFQLRYNVYCLRERFEEPKLFPDREEKDQHDDLSAHFLVRSRVSGHWLGAMRLIVGQAQDLPVSNIASIDAANIAALGTEKVAEASRLCAILPKPQRVKSTTNRWMRDRHTPAPHPSNRALHASWIAIGLIRAARQYCLEHNIETCFFLINDSLARILRQMGMEIEPIGSPLNHRGWRRPYIHNVVTGYQDMAQRSPELYQSFCTSSGYELFSDFEDSVEPAELAVSA